MTITMYVATHKVVRWPKVKCPKCAHPYAEFQGGHIDDESLIGKKRSIKWLECIKCHCQYVLKCPEGVVREGDW